MIDLKHALQLISENAAAMERHRAAAKTILEGAEKQIVGRRVAYGLGNLSGSYEITDLTLTFDGQIAAHGRKVLSTGKLGSQRRGVGTIDARRLGL